MSKRFLAFTAGTIAAVGLTAAANATLIYQNNFDNYVSGTAATPAVGTGTLALNNGGGASTAFATTGGISGGVYNAVGQTYNSAFGGGVASTGATGGTLLNLPDQDATDAIAVTFKQFTVSFWVKASATGGFNTANFPRLFVLGGSDLAANTFGLEMRSGKVDVLANGQGTGTSNAQGNVLTPDTWNFIAVTYDGTSSTAFNSTAQVALTTDAHNAQLYEGTDTAATTRFGVGDALASDFTTSTGPINLSANSLLLANRTDLSRGFAGSIDDFRIYDTLLSPTQVEAVRQSALTPEPAALGLLAVGAAGVLRRRRR